MLEKRQDDEVYQTHHGVELDWDAPFTQTKRSVLQLSASKLEDRKEYQGNELRYI